MKQRYKLTNSLTVAREPLPCERCGQASAQECYVLLNDGTDKPLSLCFMCIADLHAQALPNGFTPSYIGPVVLPDKPWKAVQGVIHLPVVMIETPRGIVRVQNEMLNPIDRSKPNRKRK